MKLENVDVVDHLVVGPDGRYSAVLLDDFQGPDETRRLTFLQAKIARYLGFIESGEAHSQLEKMIGRPVDGRASVGIRIIAMRSLGQLGERFLQHVRQDAQSVNVPVSFEVQPPDGTSDMRPPQM